MPPIDKRLLRLAAAIHARLITRQANEPLIGLPTEHWQRCVDLVHQVRRAQLRGWQLAADVLCADLRYACSSVLQELSELERSVSRPVRTAHVATVRHLYGDLQALEQDFGGLEVDPSSLELSIVTEPITLQGVYLGPFAIQLAWARFARGAASAYRVIAKDPHPAESRDNVTHPHILDEMLCEGDGRHAIRQALTQGRLLDFFTLVTGILRTYNSESPFVELALWHGSSCSDCGALVDEDECYSCQKCGATVCSGCESGCCGCEDACCSECISSCAACGDNYCRRCLQPCDLCQTRVCAGCLDEQERCPNCHEKDLVREDQTDREGAAPAGAAIRPHGLGQTPVSA